MPKSSGGIRRSAAAAAAGTVATHPFYPCRDDRVNAGMRKRRVAGAPFRRGRPSWDDGRMSGSVSVPPEGPAWLAWSVEPFTLFVLLGAAALSAAGLVRVRRVGGEHPRGAAAAWFGGVAVLAIALVSPVDTYADVSFTVHMAQHVLLTLVAPPLLALGAPVSLALRSVSPARARGISAALRSPPIAFLTTPVVAWLLFAGVPWIMHFSPLFDLALRSDLWHAIEHALWVIASSFLWWSVVGADPSPHPWSYPVRLLTLFLAMPATSFLSLAIFIASDPLYPTYVAVGPPWGPQALDAQRDAAVLMWLSSAFLLVSAMLLVAASWKRHDDERQRRLEERLDQEAGVTPVV